MQESELHIPTGNEEVHVENARQLSGVLRAKLIEGAYDVIGNHHTDELIVSDGQHRSTHPLSQLEAQSLERAVWSAGENQTLDELVPRIVRQAIKDGVQMEQADITVQLRANP